jgi:hypothetical protein
MVTKRDLVIAVLCTFCLTFTLFPILPAGSNYKTSGVGEYDPWVDLTDDGYVNAKDAIVVGKAFGSSGDPTKSVSVTNWPSIYNSSILNWPLDSSVTVTNLPLDENGNLRVRLTNTYYEWKSDSIDLDPYPGSWTGSNFTGRYRDATICISVGRGTINFTVSFLGTKVDSFELNPSTSVGFMKTYQVQGSNLTLKAKNLINDDDVWFTYSIYVTT